MLRLWTTDRLVIRQLGPGDASLVRDYGIRSREYHAPWDPVRPADWWEPRTIADRLRHELEQAVEDRGLALYIALSQEPDHIVGRVALNNIIRGAFQGCSAGYGLAPEATGHGYMTEALNEAVEIAFRELHLHRVEVSVVPRNTRSLAVAERCGFEREGISRAYIRIAGVWEDHVRFARINDGETP